MSTGNDPAEVERLRARVAALEAELQRTHNQAHHASRASEYWRRIVESLPEYVTLLDRAGRFVYINRIGPDYQGESFIGRSLEEVIGPDDWQRARAAFAQTLETGGVTEYEAHDPHRDHWFRCSVGRIVLDDGQLHLLVVSHNIDELKATERELRDARELWHSLVANSPDIILLTEPDSRVLFISKTAPGYKPEDVVGHLGYEFVQPEHQEAMRNAIREASETRQPRVFEFQDTRAQMWWRVTTVPVRDSHRGDLVLSISQDVTASKSVEQDVRRAKDELDRRVVERTAELDAANQLLRDDIVQMEAAERALRESQERFRVIAEAVPVAVVITRRSDGEVLFVNRRAGETVGVPHESMMGRRSPEFYADPAQRAEVIARLNAGASPVELELEVLHASGQRVLVSGFNQAIMFDNEPAILTGLIDITKRVETERQLRGERRLLKRLLELHERDRQLISYEVHDGIVQDMTASLMFFESSRPRELADDDPTNEAFGHGVKLLRGSIDEARRLINGLRPPVLEDEGVVPAIESLVAEMQQNSGIEIEFHSDVCFRRLAPALEMAIYRIVQEGLNNVWHHSRSAKARVELVQRDDHVEITVQDWGIGFDLAKVAKRRYGLMGVRERARLLGGRASILPVIGAGTTVKVELPLIDALMPAGE